MFGFDGRVALVFGGQGAQFTGMGQSVYQLFENAKAVFDFATSIVGFDVAKMCFESSLQDLTQNYYSQICTLTVELALYKAFSNLTVDCIAGFSLGEYAALFATGVLDMETTFKLVQTRAMTMETEVDDNIGGMIAVINTNAKELERLSNCMGVENVAISNYNSYDQTVISYKRQYYNDLILKVKQIGGHVIPLNTSRPFHHPIMRPAADKFGLFLCKQNFHEPNIELYLNITGGKYVKGCDLAEMLYLQIFNPVKWVEIIENMLAEGVNTFLEISPKPILREFIYNISQGKAKVVDIQTLLTENKGNT